MPGFRSFTPATSTILADDTRTRITRWDFAPGAETGHHSHSLAYVVVPMTDMNVRIEDSSGINDRFVPAGAAYSRPSGIEHNVINAGGNPMSFIEIEMKR
jgi:beta-alanine degradation protein BauB